MDDYETKRDRAAELYADDYDKCGGAQYVAFKAGADWSREELGLRCETLKDEVNELIKMKSELKAKLEIAKEVILEVLYSDELTIGQSNDLLTEALAQLNRPDECICGEINARHCPIHNEGKEYRDKGI